MNNIITDYSDISEKYHITKQNVDSTKLPWSEKYRPSNIDNILYHDKITKAICNYMKNNKLPHLLFYGPPGTGKCLGYNTPIIMYDGSIRMVQDIKNGDLLMGDDNTCRKVLNTTFGEDIMYNIIQSNGDDYIVNSNHIISLKLYCTFIEKKINKHNETYIKLIWFENHIEKEKIFTVCNNHSFNELQLICNSYKINLLKKLNINKKGDICDISINDYINKSINWKNVYMGFKSKQINCWQKKDVLIEPYVYGFMLGSNKIDDKFNNKNILYEYKINDIESRMQLLAGFIDAAGYLTKNNNFKFLVKTKIVLNDIIFIARSLGFIVSYNQVKPFNNEDYKVKIYGNGLELIPTKNINNKANIYIYDDLLTYKINIKKLNIDKYYGFEIDGNKRFLLGDFTVTHNTSTIITIARHYYKEDYDNMIMVLNASEERGIETVRNRIKQFAISKGLTQDSTVPPFKLIILDEIDAMTEDAQAILRKVIEKYVSNVRFCFICNYLKKINPAIQSRCVIFRFNPIPYNNLYNYVINICESEKIFITKNAIELVIKRSNGDMRKLLNILQSLYMHNNIDNKNLLKNKSNKNLNIDNSLIINENNVSKILSCPTQKNIIDIINFIQTNNLKNSYEYVLKIVNKNGISLLELINNIYEYCMDYLVNNNNKYIKYSENKIINIIKKICIINENITYCNNENIQLVSFISIFYM